MRLSDGAKTILVAVAVGFFLFVAMRDNPGAMNKSSANVKHIAQNEFTNEVLHSTQPVVVDFYATWCGPCRVLLPVMDRMAGGYAGKIKFIKVNIDESPEVARAYQVEAIPRIAMFNDGKLVDQILGLPETADLKLKLDALAAAK